MILYVFARTFMFLIPTADQDNEMPHKNKAICCL